ncbi:uncharacterized protein LOC130636868 [Hydractinia symbiolongicarpus]|uniref:uncharacterized protein LOC130636868 n=1 Tax=Hydractinia symbiolongicarpus TaxID=13093 RepID=UPI00254BE4D3|nr:uncharacterized protein LOC130636868 [Hydractinia symbiolongicarpus]
MDRRKNADFRNVTDNLTHNLRTENLKRMQLVCHQNVYKIRLKHSQTTLTFVSTRASVKLMQNFSWSFFPLHKINQPPYLFVYSSIWFEKFVLMNSRYANGVTVLNGTNVKLVWTVNVSPGDTIVSRSVYLSPDFTNPILVDRSIKKKGLKLFGENRLSATFGTGKYTMSLMDVKYNESGTFQLDVAIENDGLITTQSDIHVIVRGRPNFCDNKYPYHYTAIESGVFTEGPEVCGYPIPDVKWKIGEDNFSTLSTPSVINKATRKYKHSFRTRPITRKDCGKNFTFVTSNTLGSMERNFKIDVKFVPSLVSKVLYYRHNASCVRVTWDAEDTGKCNISYHLQFAGTKAVYNISSTNFTLCNSSYVDVVFIWASNKRNIGGKLASRINATTSLPDSLTNNAGQNVQATCDDPFTSNIITAIVTLAATLILNTIIFVILKHKGFIIVSMSRTKSAHSIKNQTTNDYQGTGAKISHYADVNSKAVKQSTYADLTTTADLSKQYYEIELNTMQTNIYANITT